MAERTYEIEVCAVCGGHLSNLYNPAGRDGSNPNGRCGVDKSHWSAGGKLLEVVPRSLAVELAEALQVLERAESDLERGMALIEVVDPALSKAKDAGLLGTE